MGKIADIYFKTEPFAVSENGFDKAYSKVSESIFSVGNEYIGTRGYFEEGYSGDTLKGSYFNGLYERRDILKGGYKGSLKFTEYMVNTVDWLYTRIFVNDEQLDLANAKISDFSRRLDLRTGLLTREFLWEVERKTKVRIRFERFVSMSNEKFAGQKIYIEAVEGKANVEIVAGLDFGCVHESVGKCMFKVEENNSSGNECSMLASTLNTNMRVYARAKFDGLEGQSTFVGETIAANRFKKELQTGENLTLEKTVFLLAIRNEKEEASYAEEMEKGIHGLRTSNYEAEFEDSKKWWEETWETSDIEIDGDELNQQGIRFCIFELHQTLHTAKYGAVFGAKGLTGEAYNGNTFWDSEVYCLPFYLYTNPDAAKSILRFRYDTLPEAKERAKDLDLKGAFYPIATVSGRECCDLWQHANLQLQASTGVFYGLWNYVHATKDYEFLFKYGAEMLVEISRMLVSRGDYDASGKHFGYYGVMGPDEFQMMVNNNAYTNFMAKKTLEYTVHTLLLMKGSAESEYETLIEKLELKEEEVKEFEKIAGDMFIPRDEETKVFEQHEGFFKLPHVDIAQIPIEEFPLYNHWAYDRIYRNDMLKQPDVLMFMMLYASEFTEEELRNNFDFYEPRCIHESSLSPSIHSILANRLGKDDMAEQYFSFATRMDLDNYNRNTAEGLHTTSIAGAWMNIVYGFSGFVSDGDTLMLAPTLPKSWNGYSYTLKIFGHNLKVRVRNKDVILSYDSNDELKLLLYGKEILVGREERTYLLSKESL